MTTKSIKNPEDFHKLFEALTLDLVQASVYYKLHVDLRNETKEYLKEYNQSPAFWNLTFDALFEASLLRLCRVYEREKSSNTLPNLLDAIKESLYIFDENNFKERLKENPYVESLASYNRTPDLGQLNLHIDYVSEERNPIVKKLIIWRNSHVAHKSRKKVIKQSDLSDTDPLTYGDMSELIDEGMKILNYYWKKFNS